MAHDFIDYVLDETRTIPVEDVRIYFPESRSNSRLLCYVKFVLGGAFKVSEARLVRLADGKLILSMPGFPKYNRTCPGCRHGVRGTFNYCPSCGERQAPAPERGEFSCSCHPLHRAQRKLIEGAVFAAYDEAIAAQKGGATCKA